MWTVVGGKKGNKHSSKKKCKNSKDKNGFQDYSEDLKLSRDELVGRIERLEELLSKEAPYLHSAEYLRSVGSFSHLSALGIGRLTKSRNSLLQFSMLICIKKLVEAQKPELVTTCFDPSFDDLDREICDHFGVAVSSANEKGLLSSEEVEQQKTLLFMPHCPYRLYCNILWSYWEKLEDIVVLGNSFRGYDLRRGLINSSSDTTDSIQLVLPHINEIPLLLTRAQWIAHSGTAPGEDDFSSIPIHELEAAFCETSFIRIPDAGALQSVRRPSREDLLAATEQDVEVW